MPEEQDKALISLGERLFHDKTLSVDGTVSCADCHRPDYAFADSRPTPLGARGARGTRNAPSLLDLPSATSFFWDGRETDLATVVLQPLTNRV
jgi:cytochrome c peroxidase